MTSFIFQKKLNKSRADIVLTTLKDLVKLPLGTVCDRPLYALEIGIHFHSGLQELEDLLENDFLKS